MDRNAQNNEFKMSDLIKKQAREMRRQERIGWIVQLVVPAVLIGVVAWICGPLLFEYLNNLVEGIGNTGGDLK